MTYAIMKNDYIKYQTELYENIDTFFKDLLNVRLDYKAAQKLNDTAAMEEIEWKEKDLRMRYESRAKVLNEWLTQFKKKVDDKTYSQILAEVNQK